jgi:hypothetical protein
MINYFVMAYPARVDSFMAPGNANPIYTSIFPDDGTNNYAASGYFVWTKSPVGYPWDIKTFTYEYICDQYYGSCQYKEVFSRGVGLYDWKYYVRKGSKFVLNAESVIDNEQGGQTTAAALHDKLPVALGFKNMP